MFKTNKTILHTHTHTIPISNKSRQINFLHVSPDLKTKNKNKKTQHAHTHTKLNLPTASHRNCKSRPLRTGIIKKKNIKKWSSTGKNYTWHFLINSHILL